jgi:N-methylhydantoinase A
VRTARILLPERHEAVEAAVYDRAALKAGDTFSGPAIIEQDDTTTLLAPGWRCQVDAAGNLMLEQNGN